MKPVIDHDKIAATFRRNFDLRDRVSSRTYLDLYDEVAKLRANLHHVIAERDATFARMLARAEAAEAERDFALKDFGQKPAPVVVRVKPLVAGRHPRGFIATDHGGGGAYIFALNGGRYECIKGLAHSPRFDTSKEALAAAQADHNARVLSQIDAVPAAQARAEPAPPDAVRDAAEAWLKARKAMAMYHPTDAQFVEKWTELAEAEAKLAAAVIEGRQTDGA